MLNLFKGAQKEPQSPKEILGRLKNLERQIDRLSQSLEKLQDEMMGGYQKTGLIRFNPFKEIGGDQSFSLALLDGENSGFVITGLYGRELNRVYVKPIKKGKSTYSLSEEEKKAIEKAINS
jgi:hypothetical protein